MRPLIRPDSMPAKPHRPYRGQRPQQRRGFGHSRPERAGGRAPAADRRAGLHGVHAVEAALRNEARTVRRLLMTENAENRLAEAVGARQLAPERVSPRDLDRLLGEDTVHQGVMLETEPLPEPDISELAERAD